MDKLKLTSLVQTEQWKVIMELLQEKRVNLLLHNRPSLEKDRDKREGALEMIDEIRRLPQALTDEAAVYAAQAKEEREIIEAKAHQKEVENDGY